MKVLAKKAAYVGILVRKRYKAATIAQIFKQILKTTLMVETTGAKGEDSAVFKQLIFWLLDAS